MRLDWPQLVGRPEIDIRKTLEPLEPLQISLHDESGQKDDIIKYIKFVVYSKREMRSWREEDKQRVIEVLSESGRYVSCNYGHNASHWRLTPTNRFRWVVCQFDGLSRSFPANIWRVLADLPESFDKTYEETLLGIDKEKREYAQRLFQCLSVSIHPCRVEELAEFLRFSSMRQRLFPLMKICG